jgi:murein DD-endopeptidase MepM/ murein hydrolase activator NlpD
MAAAAGPPAAPVRAPLMPFALEQIGAVSARLFRLESEAALLSRRLNLGPARAAGGATGGSAVAATVPAGAGPLAPAAAAAATPAAASAAPGQGGPMLPPRAESDLLQDTAGWPQRLAELEQRLLALSDASALQNLKLLRLPSRLPVLGAPVVSAFGNRSDPFTGRHAFHAGLDFAAGSGTPILAAGGGSVSFAGQRPDFGWTVEIDHGDGLVTRYAHASRLLVKQGALVTPGTQIALVGSTGRSTGAHLHFEVLRRGETVDPRRYLARE